jgi:hypothetical protein
MGKRLAPGELRNAHCGNKREPGTDAVELGRSLGGIFEEERQDLWRGAN